MRVLFDPVTQITWISRINPITKIEQSWQLNQDDVNLLKNQLNSIDFDSDISDKQGFPSKESNRSDFLEFEETA